MIPGPKSTHTAEVLFTHMLALYTNSRNIRLHMEIHIAGTCVHMHTHTQAHTLMVMNNISCESYRGQYVAVTTPFGSTSKQEMDRRAPSGRGINVPKETAWQH